MRTVQEIDRDISRIVDCLTALMMERKLTEKIEAGECGDDLGEVD